VTAARKAFSLALVAVLLAGCGGSPGSAADSSLTAADSPDVSAPVTVDDIAFGFEVAFGEATAQALGPEDSSLIVGHSSSAAEALTLMRTKIGIGDHPEGVGGVPGRSSIVVVTAGGGQANKSGLILALGLTWSAATRGNEKSLKDVDVYDPSLDQERTVNGEIDSGQSKTQVKTTFSPEGPTGTADSDVTVTTTGKDGSSIVDTAKAHVHGDVCPDPSGVVKVDYSLVWDIGAKGRHGTNRMHLDTSGQGSGQVNDDAGVGDVTADGTATFGIGSTLGTSAHREGTFTYEMKGNTPTLTKGSGALPPGISGDVVNATRDLPYKLVMAYIQFAQDAWSSGSCVEIHTTGVDAPDLTFVPAASTKSFGAKVFHRWDNKTPTFAIEATLEGEKSLSPTGKQTAPVTYAYAAPDGKGQKASVHLESRSRRGVAKLDVPLFSGQPSYVASGGQHIEMSGKIANLDKEFFLTGTGGDGVEYDFGFSGDGRFNYNGSQQGEEGSGTYEVTLAPDELSGTITMNTAKVAVTCRGRTMTRANLPPVTFTITAEK
jgi:hypothetical protein